jgi:hypothetical protein
VQSASKHHTEQQWVPHKRSTVKYASFHGLLLFSSCSIHPLKHFSYFLLKMMPWMMHHCLNVYCIWNRWNASGVGISHKRIPIYMFGLLIIYQG